MRRRTAAFTLVELLVVIGIIALLISILLPTLSKARERAERAKCLSNERQLTMAWIAYANANRGKLVSSEVWDQGWVDLGNTDDDISRGLMFPYVGTPEVYRCSTDANKFNIRSYSMNAFLNGQWSGIPAAQNLNQVRRTSEVWVFTEEYDPRGYNLGSFVLLNSGDTWVDYPATWHSHGTCMSFADGHAEHWSWSDKRTWQIKDFFTTTPNNPDLKRFQAYVGY